MATVKEALELLTDVVYESIEGMEFVKSNVAKEYADTLATIRYELEKLEEYEHLALVAEGEAAEAEIDAEGACEDCGGCHG